MATAGWRIISPDWRSHVRCLRREEVNCPSVETPPARLHAAETDHAGRSSPPRLMPTVRGLPVLGSMLAFRNDRLGVLRRVAALGPVARFSVGPLPVYAITDADLAHDVLV